MSMTDQPWETHDRLCSRRHHQVAYPRRACSECKAVEAARAEGRASMIPVLKQIGLDVEREMDDGGYRMFKEYRKEVWTRFRSAALKEKP